LAIIFIPSLIAFVQSTWRTRPSARRTIPTVLDEEVRIYRRGLGERPIARKPLMRILSIMNPLSPIAAVGA
jgi:hypothetical protein